MSDETYREIYRPLESQYGAGLDSGLDAMIRQQLLHYLELHDNAEGALHENPHAVAPPPDPNDPMAIRPQYRRTISSTRQGIKALIDNPDVERLGVEILREGRTPRNLLERVAQVIAAEDHGFPRKPTPTWVRFNPQHASFERVARQQTLENGEVVRVAQRNDELHVTVETRDGTLVDDVQIARNDAQSVRAAAERLRNTGIDWLADPENCIKLVQGAFLALFVLDGLLTVIDMQDPQLTIDMMSQYARIVERGDQADIATWIHHWTNRLAGPFGKFAGYVVYAHAISDSAYLEKILQQISAEKRAGLYHQIMDVVEQAKKQLRAKKAAAATGG